MPEERCDDAEPCSNDTFDPVTTTPFEEEPPEPECTKHDDCNDGHLCTDDEECVPVPELEECARSRSMTPFFLPPNLPDEVLTLAVIDADEDDALDLVLMASGAGQLVLGPADEPPRPLPLPEDAAPHALLAIDVDGDGHEDLVALDGAQMGRFVVLRNDGTGIFEPMAEVVFVGSVRQPSAIDWNGDGIVDVALTVAGRPSVLIGDGLGGFANAITLSDSISHGLTTGTFHGTARGVAASANGQNRIQLWRPPDATPRGEVEIETSISTLLAIDTGGSPGSGLVAHGLIKGHSSRWHLVESKRANSDHLHAHAILDASYVAAAGDVDGDGETDVVFAATRALHIFYGQAGQDDEPLFACRSTVHLSSNRVPTSIAVGDLDGDGRDEIALANGVVVTAFTSG